MYIAIFLFLLLFGYAEGDKKHFFTSPLEIPLTLSANFGELRPGHFHSGLDFKTNGVTGKKVLSVADGYIYRIKVSPGGFGNALYIRHNNGYSTVYGHLDRFAADIEEYVTDYQYREKSFSVNIFTDDNTFPVEQGEVIGYSGNSGGSLGPHLHFEVRKSSNENPVDPIQFYNIPDDIKPVLKQISIYPLGNNSLVEGRREKGIYALGGSKGNYRLNSNRVIKVNGEFGVGITAWDYLSNSWNKCGIRSLEVLIDGEPVYLHNIDEFSFSNTRFINSHIDYEEYINNSTYIQKAFLSPNNELKIYDKVKNSGRISLTDYEAHNVVIVAGDYSGNQSRVSFAVQKDSTISLTGKQEKSSGRIMPFNQRNEFIHHDIKITFPEYSFYDTLTFVYKKIPGDSTLLSDIHFIHLPSVPVHKYFNILIKPSITDTTILSKACIVSISGNDTSYVGGEYSDGFLKARIRSFGTYSIGIDTVRPEIKALNFSKNKNLRGRDELKLGIKDNFSGILGYEALIDGKWTLFEWDPKNDLLKFKFSKGSLLKNTDHKLELTVEDACGNSSTFETTFFW